MNEEILRNDGETRALSICIKDYSLQMGIFPDLEKKVIDVSQITFSIFQCKNSTMNNSCAPIEEINRVLKLAIVELSLPKSIYDFQNVENPRKRIYDYQLFSIDQHMYSKYSAILYPSILFTDHGLFFDDYQMDQTDFNSKITSFYGLRTETEESFFEFNFLFGLDFQMYYRKNQKINEVFASLGGVINILFLLGKIICLTYNSFYMYISIIKGAFSNFEKKNTSVHPKMDDSNTLEPAKNKSKFPFYLCPSKELRKFYQQGFKRLDEYLDIRKIIRRLQDIDKLEYKKVLII